MGPRKGKVRLTVTVVVFGSIRVQRWSQARDCWLRSTTRKGKEENNQEDAANPGKEKSKKEKQEEGIQAGSVPSQKNRKMVGLVNSTCP